MPGGGIILPGTPRPRPRMLIGPRPGKPGKQAMQKLEYRKLLIHFHLSDPHNLLTHHVKWWAHCICWHSVVVEGRWWPTHSRWRWNTRGKHPRGARGRPFRTSRTKRMGHSMMMGGATWGASHGDRGSSSGWNPHARV